MRVAVPLLPREKQRVRDQWVGYFTGGIYWCEGREYPDLQIYWEDRPDIAPGANRCSWEPAHWIEPHGLPRYRIRKRGR